MLTRSPSLKGGRRHVLRLWKAWQEGGEKGGGERRGRGVSSGRACQVLRVQANDKSRGNGSGLAGRPKMVAATKSL